MAVTSVASSVAQGASARKGAKIAAENARQQDVYRRERTQRLQEYQTKLSEWQHENFAKTAASIQDSLTGQYSTMLERIDQQRRQAMEQTAAYDTSTQQGLSQLRAQRAESGGGNSLRLAQQQYEAAAARQKHTAYKNLDAQVRQSMRDMLSMQAQAQGQVNAALPAPMAPIDPAQPVGAVHQPSMVPYVIQGVNGILGATANAYKMGAFDPQPTTSFAATSAPGAYSVYAPGMTPTGSAYSAPYSISRY